MTRHFILTLSPIYPLPIRFLTQRNEKQCSYGDNPLDYSTVGCASDITAKAGGKGIETSEWNHNCALSSTNAVNGWMGNAVISQAYTLEFWLEFNDPTPAFGDPYRRFVSIDGFNTGDYFMDLGQTIDSSSYDLRSYHVAFPYGGIDNLYRVGLNSAEWHGKPVHFVAVVKSNEIRLYRDGVLHSIRADPKPDAPIINGVAASLHFFNTLDYDDGWFGTIYTAAVYSEALTDKQVAAHFEAGMDLAAVGGSECEANGGVGSGGDSDDDGEASAPLLSSGQYFLTGAMVGLVLLGAVMCLVANVRDRGEAPIPIPDVPHHLMSSGSSFSGSAGLSSNPSQFSGTS